MHKRHGCTAEVREAGSTDLYICVCVCVRLCLPAEQVQADAKRLNEIYARLNIIGNNTAEAR